WEQKSRGAGEKRGDPALLAATDLEGRSVYGAVAFNSKSKIDPLAGLKNAPPVGKKKKGGDAGAAGPGGGYPGGQGGPGGPGGGLGGPGGGLGGPGGPGGGFPGGGMPGGGEDEEEEDEDAAKDATGVVRRLDPKYDRGFGSKTAGAANSPYGGGEMGAAGGGLFGPGNRSNAKPEDKKYEVARGAVFNVVTALVPHDELVKNYGKELSNSVNFDAFRDSPNYLG
ncbi:MAG: hypothetical protein ACKN9U_23845, partial [Pirellulaceae bacterium]